MTVIDAIRERHSVRNYQDRAIEAEIAAQLEVLITEINEASGLHFQFIAEAGKTFSRLLNKAMGLGSAPSVIACVGPDEEGLEERIGYFGELIVLTAQQMGLNTCWAGTFNKDKIPAKVKSGERLVIVIAIGYGVNGGKTRKSKTLSQVSSSAKERPEWFVFGVEMALLAPTAINQQKFEIRLESDDTVTFIDKGGVLSKVDLGIVKYHFEIGKKAILEPAPVLDLPDED